MDDLIDGPCPICGKRLGDHEAIPGWLGNSCYRLALKSKPEPDWIDENGKKHRYKCGLNPDPAAIKHMVSYCTCSALQRFS
jgi:hypothetical protein